MLIIISSVQAQINNLEVKAINLQIDKDYSQPREEEDHKKDRTARRQEDIRKSRPQVSALATIPHNKGEYFLSSFSPGSFQIEQLSAVFSFAPTFTFTATSVDALL